jgi:hypothetical protein
MQRYRKLISADGLKSELQPVTEKGPPRFRVINRIDDLGSYFTGEIPVITADMTIVHAREYELVREYLVCEYKEVAKWGKK